MRAPTIHPNGTPVRSLLAEADGALFATQNAIEAVRRMTVNPRDFYVQYPGAHEEASNEHAAILRKLAEVEAELSTYFSALLEQEEKR